MMSEVCVWSPEEMVNIGIWLTLKNWCANFAYEMSCDTKSSDNDEKEGDKLRRNHLINIHPIWTEEGSTA